MNSRLFSFILISAQVVIASTTNSTSSVVSASTNPVKSVNPVNTNPSVVNSSVASNAPVAPATTPANTNPSASNASVMPINPSTTDVANTNTSTAPAAQPAPANTATGSVNNTAPVSSPANTPAPATTQESTASPAQEKPKITPAAAYLMPELATLPQHQDSLALNGYSFADTKNGQIAAVMHLLYVLQEQMIRSPLREPLSLLAFQNIFSPRFTEDDLNQIFRVVEVDGANNEFFRFALKALFRSGNYEVFLKLFKRLYVEPIRRDFPVAQFHEIFGDFAGYSGAIKTLFTSHNQLFTQLVNLRTRSGQIDLLNTKFLEGILRAEAPQTTSWIVSNADRIGEIVSILITIYPITTEEDGVQSKLKTVAETLAEKEGIIIRSKLRLANQHRFPPATSSPTMMADELIRSTVPALSLLAFLIHKQYMMASILLANYSNPAALVNLHFDPDFHAQMMRERGTLYKRLYPSQPPDAMFTYNLPALLKYYGEKDLGALLHDVGRGALKIPAVRLAEAVLTFGKTDDFKKFVMDVARSAEMPAIIKTLLKIKATHPNLNLYLQMIKDKLGATKVRIPSLDELALGAEAVETLVAAGILSFTGSDFLSLLSNDTFYQAFVRHRDALTVTQTGPLPAPGNETEITRATEFPLQIQQPAITPLSQFPCTGRYEGGLLGGHLSTLYRKQQVIKLRFLLAGVPKVKVAQSKDVYCEERETLKFINDNAQITTRKVKERYFAAGEKCQVKK